MTISKTKRKGRNSIRVGKGSQIHKTAILGHPSMRMGGQRGLTVGGNLVMLAGSIIYEGSSLGNDLIVGHNAIIREENIIGDRLKLWSNSIIDYGCRIANNVKIHSNCYVAQYTVIEDDVFLAPGVTIGNDPHPGCEFSGLCIKKAYATIKCGAQIGLNVTILPGVTIGEKALIGAGSVVTKNVPSESVVVGNPGKVIRKVFDLKCTTGLTDKPYKNGK